MVNFHVGGKVLNRYALGDCDAFVEIDVLYGVQQLNTLLEGALKSFSTQYKSHSSCSFIYYSGYYGFLQIIFTLAFPS